MPLYAVAYTHPNAEGWQRHLMPHVAWLRARAKEGVLRASGPLKVGADCLDAARHERSALLVLSGCDRDALDAIMHSDPFWVEGLIADITVTEWDAIFGAFNADSSMPERHGVNM